MKKAKMKIVVLCDKSGNIESVAMLNPALADLHVEIEGGGGAVHELSVDADVIAPEDLLGKNGPEPQRQVYEKLRRIIQRPS
jgi:hypothetical protein